MLIALKNYQDGGVPAVSLATATFIMLLKTHSSKYTK